ncbi:hypothetical protein [Pseudoalteromonas sp.]|uniref:hypothetical protein n=1 Tax=Pseudoalteromonas sp. TaxID=53249 RepID=UPI002630FC8F|nr:hypothetical protein [Pseudoalteromonas sp.]MCP4585329.1 hypothetical protein [Pseudoalteromonas sp.]
MGKDMASSDAPFGFIPYGEVLRARTYAVNTAPTVAIAVGDLVVAGGAVVATPAMGRLMDIEDSAYPASTAPFLGAILAVFDENMFPVAYLAASEAGNGTIAGYVLVADHPYQQFLAQEDGVANAIDLDEGGQNADVIGTHTPTAANNYHGKMEIDSSSAGTGAALAVKLVAPHMDDTPADDSNPNARWICQINEHYYGSTIAGV